MGQSGLRFLLRALRHRNYRLFFGGQAVSLIGTWMQQIAMGWLAYRLTNSPFILGIIGFSAHLPIFLFTAVAGVYSDRWNRHRVLLATQTLSMIQALTLALLTLTGLIQVWHLIVLSACLGLINALDIPARQSFVVEMIEERGDLGNAIALNSLIFNGARLLGPTVAGFIIVLFSEGVCFLMNGISFIAIIVMLLAMRIPPKEKAKHAARFLHVLKEGYAYASGFVPIRYILLQLALISFMSMSYIVLLPVFARDILQGGPETMGFLMAASGLGAIAGSIYLASRGTVLGLGRVIAAASALLGVGMIFFSQSGVLALSLCMMFLMGGGIMVQIVSGNTLLQTIVDDDKRGRVMSFFSMAVMGMGPFGSLFAGVLASRIGAPATLFLCGFLCVLGAFFFARRLPEMRKVTRPIYVRMGILPETPKAP
jgi:MFS family permease